MATGVGFKYFCGFVGGISSFWLASEELNSAGL
jgi:hypothetical protein